MRWLFHSVIVLQFVAHLCYTKDLPEVKAIVEIFVGSGILVTQAKVSLQTTGLVTPLLTIKNQYKCLVEPVETMESVKYTIKEVVQALQKLTSEKPFAALPVAFK